ncbi:MAG: MMPL family transporter [Planctomyces sp.]|nr:MMPL family transporter [Planctomyces sp.]
MYDRLGDAISRRPWRVVFGWAILLAALLYWAPAPQRVAKDGVFTFLPEGSPSLQAERLFREAFPNAAGDQQDPLGSNVVIVIRREDQRGGLTDADRHFVNEVLTPLLDQIRLTTPAGRDLTPGMTFEKSLPAEERRVRAIWTAEHDRTGPLLNSVDGHSTLVVMELNGEFLNYGNALVISRIEHLLASRDLQEQIPPGLDLAISGSATVGRDMLNAEQKSASSTDHWTKALVIILLLLIYRAPIVAMIPLLTVGVAVASAVRLLSLMASWEWIGFFAGMQVYVLVVAYGAGVDYCLFLIARFREQLSHGATYEDAVSHAVKHVGVALTASAGASICGILMMMFAEFGKFRQAGFAISFGLFVVLLCALTLTPAMLRLVAKWAFWPDVRREHISAGEGWIPSPGLLESLQETRWFDHAWRWIARLLEARPLAVFLTSMLVMLPFAIAGAVFHDHLSYGLLTDLPQQDASVVGARAIQRHFPAGVTGVATVLLKHEGFGRPAPPEGAEGEPREGSESVPRTVLMRHQERIASEITENLQPQFEEIGLMDLRSQRHPLGLMKNAQDYFRAMPRTRQGARRLIAHKSYASDSGPHAGTVIRLDLVFDEDPFSRDSIAHLSLAEEAVRKAIPPEYAGAELYTLGPTAGIRDLKSTTDRDQVRIAVLVVAAVYLVLLLLLRQPAVCLYLIISVVFSYLVTIGVAHMVFYLKDPANFAGLDWKVPIFTFTLLIALGEDYNILLMARVMEEQRKHGLIPGVLIALQRTGGIISSCGIIMAGTFCSLMTGSMAGMVQLGFAVAFGVLLDTFVVRPVLVPAYLLLLYSDRFGRFGRWLGKPRSLPEPSALEHALAEAADDETPTTPE